MLENACDLLPPSPQGLTPDQTVGIIPLARHLAARSLLLVRHFIDFSARLTYDVTQIVRPGMSRVFIFALP